MSGLDAQLAELQKSSVKIGGSDTGQKHKIQPIASAKQPAVDVDSVVNAIKKTSCCGDDNK